jgi:hypothetical protein
MFPETKLWEGRRDWMMGPGSWTEVEDMFVEGPLIPFLFFVVRESRSEHGSIFTKFRFV